LEDVVPTQLSPNTALDRAHGGYRREVAFIVEIFCWRCGKSAKGATVAAAAPSQAIPEGWAVLFIRLEPWSAMSGVVAGGKSAAAQHNICGECASRIRTECALKTDP
jgi:hypothetical protein